MSFQQLFPPLDPAELDLIPTPAPLKDGKGQFEQLAQDLADTLNGHATVLDDLFRDVSLYPTHAVLDTFLSTPINDAETALTTEQKDTGYADPISTTHITTMDQAISHASSLVPAEAYGPTPQAIAPPPELGGFGPEIPAPGAAPIGSGAGGGPGIPPNFGEVGPHGPAYGPGQVLIRNSTRVNATDFAVGEHYYVSIHGMPNGAITVSGSHEGFLFSNVAFGVTDDAGDAVILGQMSAVDRGAWSERWYVSGRQAQPALQFYVR